jgi:hypothetical protein
MDSGKQPANEAATLIFVHELLHEIGLPPSREIVERVADRVRDTLHRLVDQERERCVAICKKRAALWSNTPVATSPAGLEESRARANEATYIADAIRSA